MNQYGIEKKSSFLRGSEWLNLLSVWSFLQCVPSIWRSQPVLWPVMWHPKPLVDDDRVSKPSGFLKFGIIMKNSDWVSKGKEAGRGSSSLAFSCSLPSIPLQNFDSQCHVLISKRWILISLPERLFLAVHPRSFQGHVFCTANTCHSSTQPLCYYVPQINFDNKQCRRLYMTLT
jgi:hypothetical protein